MAQSREFERQQIALEYALEYTKTISKIPLLPEEIVGVAKVFRYFLGY